MGGDSRHGLGGVGSAVNGMRQAIQNVCPHTRQNRLSSNFHSRSKQDVRLAKGDPLEFSTDANVKTSDARRRNETCVRYYSRENSCLYAQFEKCTHTSAPCFHREVHYVNPNTLQLRRAMFSMSLSFALV